MTRLYLIGAVVVIALIGGAFMAGRWTAPGAATPSDPLVLEKTLPPLLKTVYVDRVVTRTKHVVETKLPDGTVTKTTDTTDNAHTKSADLPPPPDQAAKIITALAPKEKNWRVGVSVGLTINPHSGIVPQYGLEADRWLIGPMWLGIRANTGGYVGAALGVEF